MPEGRGDQKSNQPLAESTIKRIYKLWKAELGRDEFDKYQFGLAVVQRAIGDSFPQVEPRIPTTTLLIHASLTSACYLKGCLF